MLAKKCLHAAIAVGLGLTLSTGALAAVNDGTCIVVGYHQPGTNIYDGPTTCGDFSLSNIVVHGPLKLSQTTITGETNVSGPMTTSGATLSNVVMNDHSSHETVTLQANTKVNGDITFKGSAGTVYLSGGSSISGKVINGRVINQ